MGVGAAVKVGASPPSVSLAGATQSDAFPTWAIVFISDGAPTDSTTYLSVVNPRFPIYGIFLGDTRSPYQRLETLSSLSGGRFFRVDPKDIVGMNRVMDAVIRAITVRSYPNSIHIINTSLTPPQASRSRGTDLILHPDGKVTPRQHAPA
ncbi:MAG: hypothetical protein M3Y08_02740 [Fibrobacterota bacterium]|nr:hypothetical protein [Fibrobacterota bacterium]